MSGPRAEHPPGGHGSPEARRAGRSPVTGLLVLLLLLGVLGAPAVEAQAPLGDRGPVLTRRVQEALKRLQEGWLRWTSALYGDDSERALAVVEDLSATAAQLGMEQLPDLSAGAAVLAVESAREGEAERATVALAAAERLAPGRPETAFAEAEVARLSGRYLGYLSAQVRGYVQSFRTEALRDPLAIDLVLWLLVSLLVSGAFYVALLMVTRGRSVVNGLGQGLARRMPFLPGAVVQVLILVVLLFPLALPWGPVWLALYWSLLLWRPALSSQRSVLVFLWLVAAVTPAVVGELRWRLDLELSPPVRAMDSVIERRLYGELFKDLSVLPTVLPDHVAVRQFLGDVHARLGQWEVARERYEEVLDQEPENVAALIDLGAYYFNQGDYGNAVSRFQQATSIDSQSTAAYFNLSKAYAESYLYDETREALLEARAIDDLQVTEWMGRSEGSHVVTAEGGIARRAEIEAALIEAWSSESSAPLWRALLERLRTVVIFVGILAVAFALLAVLRRVAGGPASGSLPPSWPAGRETARWRGLVPGLLSAGQGRGVAAFFAAFVPTSLVVALVACVGRGFGYPVPWRYDPGDGLLLLVSVACLAAMVAVRAVRALRSGS